MTAAFVSSILCPIVVGRAPVLASVERLLAQTSAGRGATALVSGEAGIGKSRLVAEARALAASNGLGLLTGNCFETDRTLPYAPFADLLRSLVAGVDPARLTAVLGSGLPELVRIAPALADLVPAAPASQATEPEQEQRRIFHAVGELLARLAAERPLLVVIEDVHWCDDTSLDLLLTLARQTVARPILLLLTFRSDEIQPALRHLLAMLDRERLATDVPLSRLAAEEVDLMLRAMFAQEQPVNREFVETLFALTEGNPFFVEEIISALVAAGQIVFSGGRWSRPPVSELRIPRSVQDAVQRRAQRLSPPARDLLVIAAVAGRRFDFALLQTLTASTEDETLRRIKELIAAQLVAEESADRFAFRHALTRQAIYHDLLARERRTLHRQVAETIEQRSAEPSDAEIAELAYHYAEAEVWEKALEYARRAGERAEVLYTPRATIEQFTRAIEAAGHLGLEPPIAFFIARGRARDTAGDFDGALADDTEALRLVRAAGDSGAETQALIALGVLWSGRAYPTAGQYFEQAVAAAQRGGDRWLQARSLNRHGNWLGNTGRTAESIAIHQQALAIFANLGDAPGEAATYDLLGMSYGMHGDVIACVEHYDQAIERFRALGDMQLLASSLTGRAVYAASALTETSYARLGKSDDVRRDSAEALELTQQIHWYAGESFAEWNAGVSLGAAGILGPALRHAERARRIAADIGHTQWLTASHWAIGQVYYWGLDGERAVAALETALELSLPLGSVWWNGHSRLFLALAYLLTGAPEQAEATLASMQPAEHAAVNASERRVCLAWAEVTLARGEPERALRIIDALLASVPGAASQQPIPWPLRVRGDALAALGRPDEALVAYDLSLTGARQRLARPLEWRSLAALAQHAARGRAHDLAETHASAAREVIAGMAATIEDEQQQAAFSAAAEAWLPRSRPLSSAQATKRAWGGLTARERDVAREIAEGKSNREIAKALNVSEWTIETHVSNILSKLEFTSRVQIALWVAERA